MIVLGIDPGLHGALAVIEGRERLPVLLGAIDVPLIEEGNSGAHCVDALAVMEFIREYNPGHAFIERAQAMPVKGRHGADPEEAWQGQGASSALNYGRAAGYLECCVKGLLIPLKRIEAVAWKKTNGLIKADKEASRQRALRVFPAAAALLARKKDQHRAEAALIAWHGLMLIRSP